MSTQFERLAARIEAECAGCDPRDKDVFRGAVRAVLEELREPTRGMVDAVDREAERVFGNAHETLPTERVWEVMIDVVLKEDPGVG